ncbi:MAG: WG repeat-containing protein [SAR324 cluster bacterium]|nr:WG repeat-containing protein [SAR324 cluster bacterium]
MNNPVLIHQSRNPLLMLICLFSLLTLSERSMVMAQSDPKPQFASLDLKYEDLVAIKKKILHGEDLFQILSVNYPNQQFYLLVLRDRMDGDKYLEGVSFWESVLSEAYAQHPHRNDFPFWVMDIKKYPFKELKRFHLTDWWGKIRARFIQSLVDIHDSETDSLLHSMTKVQLPDEWLVKTFEAYLHDNKVIFFEHLNLDFHLRLVPARRQDEAQQWGYMDETGKIVIDFQFDEASPFGIHQAAVSKQGKWGYIDRTGHVVIPLSFDFALPFSEGVAAVRLNDRWGLILENGQMITDFEFEDARPFSAGQIAVKHKGKWGVMAKTGQIVVDFNDQFPEFDSKE